MAAALYPLAHALQSCSHNTTASRQPILVLIQLVGGNDGLNTLIPLTDYKKLMTARPNLYIPESRVLRLKNTDQAGLHPSMTGIRDLYNEGLISFVQGVGYENQNYSHFRSSDIYLTGSDASRVLYTGWMARFLETRFPHYPDGFPSAQHPDPPAIKVGDNGTFIFQGSTMDLSIVINPATGFVATETDNSPISSDSYAAQEVHSIREILLQTERYASVLKKALSVTMTHASSYPAPGENPLADQLKTVAKLIKGGLQTSVYHVDLKGFDTHADQVDSQDTTKGLHARLLGQVSQAVSCFWQDIQHIGRDKDVTGMSFSEFGRRIASNAAHGTDHGASQPFMFFGQGLRSGIVGSYPEIPDELTPSDNLKMQYDHRAVYRSVLKNRMGVSVDKLDQILPGSFADIHIFS